MGRFARKFGAAQSSNASSEADKKPDQGSASKTTAQAQASTDKTSSKDKVVNKKEADAAKPVEAAKQEQANDDMDFFDLALEGEEVEVTGHKVVEETGGKKGKKGTGKKK